MTKAVLLYCHCIKPFLFLFLPDFIYSLHLHVHFVLHLTFKIVCYSLSDCFKFNN